MSDHPSLQVIRMTEPHLHLLAGQQLYVVYETTCDFVCQDPRDAQGRILVPKGKAVTLTAHDLLRL